MWDNEVLERGTLLENGVEHGASNFLKIFDVFTIEIRYEMVQKKVGARNGVLR